MLKNLNMKTKQEISKGRNLNNKLKDFLIQENQMYFMFQLLVHPVKNIKSKFFNCKRE